MLEYTLDFQVSDFFAFQGMVISDTVSDGQRLKRPRAHAVGERQRLHPGYGRLRRRQLRRRLQLQPDRRRRVPDQRPSTNDGTTTLYFRISNELVTRGQRAADGRLRACGGYGWVGPELLSPVAYNDGPTTGTVKFRTTCSTSTPNLSIRKPHVDQGDAVDNVVGIDGRLLSVANTNNLTGFSEADDSGASVSLAGGALIKTIYAINGAVCPSGRVRCRSSRSGRYPHLPHKLPTSDRRFRKLRFPDYLPLPVFRAVDPNATGATSHTWTYDGAGNPTPASGKWQRGPADTQFARSAIVPTVTTDGVSNSAKWTMAHMTT